MIKKFLFRYHLLLKTLPWVGLILITKYFINSSNLEFMEYFPLIGNLIAANFFLMGFLVGETLKEFRQAEKLPGQLASILENIVDLVSPIEKSSPQTFRKMLRQFQIFAKDIRFWIYKKHSSSEFYEILRELTVVFNNKTNNDSLPPKTFETFVRERNSLRSQLFLIDVMRKTDFVSASYLIARMYSFAMIFLLLFTNFNSLRQGMILIALISFVYIYLLLLVQDLDNPFSYEEKESPSSRVSLKQIINFEKRIEAKLLLLKRSKKDSKHSKSLNIKRVN